MSFSCLFFVAWPEILENTSTFSQMTVLNNTGGKTAVKVRDRELISFIAIMSRCIEHKLINPKVSFTII